MDANVLIFERIREETKAYRPFGPSIGLFQCHADNHRRERDDLDRGGFALSIRFRPVRGFAVTLAIGILTSMFTAIMVTRLMVIAGYDRKKPKVLKFETESCGIKFIPDNLEMVYLKARFLLCFLDCSGVFVAGRHGFPGLNFGIDFKGGILSRFGPMEPPISGPCGKISGLDLGEVNLQEFGAPEDVLIGFGRKAARRPNPRKRTAGRRRGSPGPWRRYRIPPDGSGGPKVSSALLKDGLWAVGLAMFAIMAYIWFRFEWQFGLGAVVALIHDVIATIGVFALMRSEFNLSTVAAVLTIAAIPSTIPWSFMISSRKPS